MFRNLLIINLIILFLAICSDAAFLPDIKGIFNEPYEAKRDAIIVGEQLLTTGGHLLLNSREQQVNDIFLRLKSEELSNGFNNAEQNAGAMHFFKAKPLIEASPVFQFLQQMPKGALLHVHTSASVSSKWVVKNLFYMPGLLRCVRADGVSVLSFRHMPDKHNCVTEYVEVNKERQQFSAGPEEYDRAMEALINLYTPQPEVDYSTINQVWTKFQNMFSTMSDVLVYIPAVRSYYRQMLQEMYDDNIMYSEVRMNLYELYDQNGTTFAPEQSLNVLMQIVAEFQQVHPDFLGIKVIISPNRNAAPEAMQQRFNTFKINHSKYPKELIGFDLVGQEDTGKPLHEYVNILKQKPETAKFFFHAGETNWFGGPIDYNILDALLLNTTRIGHGYALMKHPLLWNTVKARDIALEVNPLSNQILHLVWDLRNHPGTFFMAENIPIVICNDDPGFWNAKGLSYDFYYAIMSMAPNYAGLKTLKQLVWNSVKYSSFDEAERQRAYQLLQKKWDEFIENVLSHQ
ncbi:adenosine deaminase 2-like [Musca vetustissima]|uniref:adenosine deaminase 2-like n=1 Tax=Musca vetustissima TaxID=27455 RepID=UPI002AB7CB7E|nr:adenosine deaminase 2-like [Musca vetustissima]